MGLDWKSTCLGVTPGVRYLVLRSGMFDWDIVEFLFHPRLLSPLSHPPGLSRPGLGVDGNDPGVGFVIGGGRSLSGVGRLVPGVGGVGAGGLGFGPRLIGGRVPGGYACRNCSASGPFGLYIPFALQCWARSLR